MEQDEEEVFADTFAECLLMPEQAIIAMGKSGMPLWEIAYRFGVSVEKVRSRLDGLGVVKGGNFYEDDEPIGRVRAAWRRGVKGRTSRRT